MELKQLRSSSRNSPVMVQPEQFVTIQIHNHHFKKKYRHYRESIINEIKITHDRVEETLNKCARPSKSKFKYRSTCKNRLGATVRKLKEQQNTMQAEKQYSFSPEVNKKLQQLSNISKYFQRACLPKEIPNKFVDLSRVSYTLPIVNAEPIVAPSLRSKDQLQEEQTLIREWRETVKLGRDHVKFMKERNPLRYRQKNSKFSTGRGQEKQNLGMPRKSLKSLRDVYFSPIKQERKTTPAECNNLSLLVCQKKSNKAAMTYDGNIEQQEARRLQQFIEGGALKQINEFTRYISIPQFLKSKQKFKTLATIYNHVKNKTILESKESCIANFQTPSILSVIYYVENAHNLTQNEKKTMRNKLKFSD